MDFVGILDLEQFPGTESPVAEEFFLPFNHWQKKMIRQNMPDHLEGER